MSPSPRCAERWRENPSSPENWLRLIGLYVEQKNFEAIEGVLREAHLASDADALPILTGKKVRIVIELANGRGHLSGKLCRPARRFVDVTSTR